MKMPSFREAKRIYGSNLTIGQQLKQMSDMAMEETWGNNIQSKVCYIYDYYHDDQPDKKDHMTYERTTKTRIDAKFIVKSYQSIDKDQVDYYIQFKPSQPVEFTKNDQLYYYEQDFRRKYGAEFPTGLYCDIPDEKGVYRKWMIILSEPANQFTKYLVLPINYNFMWIERNGKERMYIRVTYQKKLLHILSLPVISLLLQPVHSCLDALRQMMVLMRITEREQSTGPSYGMQT